jgi:hypothetical protein
MYWYPSSKANTLVVNAFSTVFNVPSGRALFVDVKPVRTFADASYANEYTYSNRSVPFIVPSGGQKFGTTYYDPAVHGLIQATNVAWYDGAFTLHDAYRDQYIIASGGDLTVKGITVNSTTVITLPTFGLALGGTTAFYHACDVKIYECSADYAIQGLNFTAPGGLLKYPFDSTSVYQE